MAAANQLNENRDIFNRTPRSVALCATVCLEENSGHFEILIN